ncbi:MAG TPA: LLM class flavin-dependent oxidoreductase [Roseomonas sp.]|nr:LLM class flavin-dependent oxidoreductase [Roseomonas sp.]
MKLAVLDQSAATVGRPHEETIQDTIALAHDCEAMGYHRYWLAEHHNSPANVGPAPEILAAAIAATTSRIRVGSAGVLLSHYAPLKVAEQFRVLSAIAPGRVDLGLGRSPGGNAATQAMLNGNAAIKPFDVLVEELLGWLEPEPSSDPQAVQAYPRTLNLPEVWTLGSSLRGANLAARLGLPFCFNYSHGSNHHLVGDAISAYRREFCPSWRLSSPLVSLSVWVLAAPNDQEARHLFASRAYWRVMLDRGFRVPMYPPEEALAEPVSVEEKARISQTLQYSIVGSDTAVAQRLRSIAVEFGADELVLGTWTHAPEARRWSYAALARRLLVG